MKLIGIWGIAGMVLGFVLAELLIDGNREVYVGIVTLLTVLGGAFGNWRSSRGKGAPPPAPPADPPATPPAAPPDG